MDRDSLILVTATLGAGHYVLKSFTGLQDRQALDYAEREADTSGADISLRILVPWTATADLATVN